MTTVGFPGGSGPFTVEDLERIPDDGRRHELLDGVLVFELDDAGIYAQVAEVKGEDSYEAEVPFPVRIVPAELLGTRWGRGYRP